MSKTNTNLLNSTGSSLDITLSNNKKPIESPLVNSIMVNTVINDDLVDKISFKSNNISIIKQNYNKENLKIDNFRDITVNNTLSLNNIKDIEKNYDEILDSTSHIIDLNDHFVYYLNGIPVVLEVFLQLKNYKLKLNDMIKRKYTEISKTHREYYIKNLLAYINSNVYQFDKIIDKLENSINEINLHIEEIKENIDNRNSTNNVSSSIEELESTRKKLIEKIKLCDDFTNKYKRKAIQEINEKKKLNMASKKKSSKNLKGSFGQEFDLSKLTIDELIDELKEEKDRIKEIKMKYLNGIYSCEVNIKHLKESLTILSIKPMLGMDDKNVENLMIEKD